MAVIRATDCCGEALYDQLLVNARMLSKRDCKYAHLDVSRALQEPLIQLPGVLPVAFADLKVYV